MITNEYTDSSSSSSEDHTTYEDDDGNSSDDAIDILTEVMNGVIDNDGGREEDQFTEYEVDSDADRELEKQRVGDRDSSKESDEDSIIAVSFFFFGKMCRISLIICCEKKPVYTRSSDLSWLIL